MGTDTMAPALTAIEYDLVYNMISFGLASMGASTVFFFLRIGSFHERYKAALCFTGLRHVHRNVSLFQDLQLVRSILHPMQSYRRHGGLQHMRRRQVRLLSNWHSIQRRLPLC